MSIPAPKGKVGRIIGLHRRKFGQAAACFSGKEQRQQCLVIPRRKVFKAVDFTMRISLSHSIPACHACLREFRVSVSLFSVSSLLYSAIAAMPK